jgi:hypothetical protein
MDSRPKYYRAKAEEVRRLAAMAADPDIRAEFLNIAAQYERMAEQLDHQERHREVRIATNPERNSDREREDAR